MQIFLLLLSLVFAHGGRCVNSNCAAILPDYLNVHIVPHSHDDVGWLKTVEQYYYGANNSIQIAGVQYIYDSVLDELWNDPAKKFVSVEMEFFSHWWKELDGKTREKVTQVINQGQLEFVGAGWCMNDEAAASYVDIIDQMTLGMKFLNETFGSCSIPKAVWQVDPFGHSREQASIFAQMGFEYLFLGRIDHQDKSTRLQNRQMEMMWNVSDSLDISLFTGVLYNTYSPPSGFCFDVLCGDETIVDDPDSPMFNIDRRSKQLVAYILEQSKHFATNNIILTMGEDFHYQYAHAWYKNLDKLISYINENYAQNKIRLFYSTPSCYGEAVTKSLRSDLPWKWDDFFPYSSDPHAYWTGYFTSRPSFKGLVRKSSNLLQAVKQLEAASSSSAGKASAKLFQFERNQGIAQHHDAITGTAKQHVSNDYVKRLDQSMRAAFDIIDEAYQRLGVANVGQQQHCLMLNVSECHATEATSTSGSKLVVTLYNPLAFSVSHVVRLPVSDSQHRIITYNVNGQEEMVPGQLVPIPNNILDLPGRKSDARYELVFLATDLLALGSRSYHVTVDARRSFKSYTSLYVAIPAPEDVTVSTNDWKLRFDRLTGLLVEIANQTTKFPVHQDLLYYPGMVGNNSRFEFRASGAYIFRPNGTAIPTGSISQLVIAEGPVVTEIYQEFSDWSSQIIRLVSGQPYVEVDWIVGPIPVEDNIGKEVITRFTVRDMKTEGIFYTDSNGREILQRRVNFQSTYQVKVTEPEAGNYYPVNAVAYVEDVATGRRMAVLNDRAQGASSLQEGSLEFMIHRRLLHDDAFGVAEALNESEYGEGVAVRGSHWLLLTESALWRKLSLQKNHPPIVTFAPTALSFNKWGKLFKTQFSLMSRSLPDNVHLLTMEPWDEGRILMRLEHFYAVGEDSLLAQPVTFSIKGLFTTFDVLDVDLVDLSGNQKTGSLSSTMELTLSPMQIQTLLLSVKDKF